MNSTRALEHAHPIALAIGGAIALASAMGIGRFVYTPILPEMVAALHLTASEAGLIASANFAGYLIGALVAAAHVFAPHRRGWMLGALLISALTTGAMAATDSLVAFLLLRFLSGFASAFALVFTSSLVLDRLSAAGRSHMAGHQFAGVGAGIAVSAILVAQLTAHHVAWQWQWIATALLSLVAVFAVAALIPARREGGGVAAANRNGGIGSPLAALILAYGLFGFGYVITATFLVQLVRTSSEMAPLEPFIWVIVGLAGIPSVALWAAIGRRIGLGHGYALACLVEAAGVLSSVLWNAPAGAILAAILLGGTFVGITVLGLVGARRLATGAASRIIGLMTASFGLGQIIGPIFAGWMHDLTGTFLLPSVAAAAALVLAAALVWWLSAEALRRA
ncbi:YbfB/YjiJ family MFS transporter [Dongia deserti]|uniref:YbfB/YjiJ family MFS transporter n=1 Tax=Dongia deserti TaxID=2268030 RepID=UPI0025499DF5|nr:YbfB/YjiJ family MFS transporter [Dongia deserti]